MVVNMGAVFEGDVLAFDPAPLTEALAERFEERRRFGRTEPQKPNPRRLRLLRLGGERRGEETAAESREERSTIYETPPSNFFSAVSKRARMSLSRTLRASLRRRRLSSARHRSEQASRLQGPRGPPHAVQT